MQPLSSYQAMKIASIASLDQQPLSTTLQIQESSTFQLAGQQNSEQNSEQISEQTNFEQNSGQNSGQNAERTPIHLFNE